MELAMTPKTAPLIPPPLKIDDGEVVNKAVWIQLTFSLLGNSRKVQDSEAKVTSRMAGDDDPDKRMVKITKMLLDSPELDSIRSNDSDFRNWVYKKCLPYDTGLHWLPFKMIRPVIDGCKEYADRREGLIEVFCDNYEALCEESSRRLKTLYKATDYPPLSYVRNKFSFKWKIVNLGTPGQLREFDPELFQEEVDKRRAEIREAADEARLFLRSTLLDMLTRLKNSLAESGGKRKRLYDTAVTSFQEFLNDLPDRDISNDVETRSYADQIRKLLKGVSVEQLRESDTMRNRVRNTLDEIGEALQPLVKDMPGRKFRMED